MPFDIFTMAAIRYELARELAGGRVDRVIQPSELSVAMRLWAGRRNRWLLLSADTAHARVHIADEKLAKGFERPSPFLMLLRKYCTGARIGDVRQEHLERVLYVDLGGGPHGPVTLVAEVMGRRSNVILVSDAGEILGAVKLIGPQKSRARTILPHVAYSLPPPQRIPDTLGPGEKIDPRAPDVGSRLTARLKAVPPATMVTEALVGLVQGCSPSIAADIAIRGGVRTATAVREIDVERLSSATAEQYGLLESCAFVPTVVLRDGRPADYRAYSVDGSDETAATTMSEAIDLVSAGLESVDTLHSSRERIKRRLADLRSGLESKAASLTRQRERAGDAEQLKEWGNLVLGFQHQIEPGTGSLDVPDMAVSIPLQPDLTPVENAERYFKRYRKAREAGKRIPGLLARAQTDLDFVEELGSFVDMAESESDLKNIEAEMEELLGRPRAEASDKKAPPKKKAKILTVDLPGGGQALVGRSAAQNEEVTFKLAGRRDLWLHARGVPGAHVVVRGVPEDAAINGEPSVAILTAASLAAYYSKAREETAVDVMVARTRDVKAIAGGAPGQVICRAGRTIRVAPLAPSR